MCSRSCHLQNNAKPYFHSVLWAPKGVTTDQCAAMADTTSHHVNIAALAISLRRARLTLTILTTSNYYYTVMEWFNMILLPPPKSTTYRQEVQTTHTDKKRESKRFKPDEEKRKNENKKIWKVKSGTKILRQVNKDWKQTKFKHICLCIHIHSLSFSLLSNIFCMWVRMYV